MARVHVDNSGERFGSKATIADLAAFAFDGIDSKDISVYQAYALVERDWPREIEDAELENSVGTRFVFKDGSKLSVGAWANLDEDGVPFDDPDKYPECTSSRFRN